MAKYTITGGTKLQGTVKISGNKNATFPCIAAALLTNQPVKLHNIPRIADIDVMIEILKAIGVEVSFQENSLTINANNISTANLPQELTTKLRGSVVLVGALLARKKEVTFSHPGGDIIGKRSIEPHIEGFTKLGYNFEQNDLNYHGYRSDRAAESEIFLHEPTVTGTENLILATAMNPKTVTLKNCAQEPHVVDLCQMLVQMGVRIEGIGSSTLVITGQEQLEGTEYSISSDHVEFCTYAIAAAITKGEIVMINTGKLSQLEPAIHPLRKMGIEFEETKDGIKAWAKELIATEVIKVNIWPGFPSDNMSLAVVLATQAKGITLCHEWMYEGRMFWVDKLISMGANITIADPHRVVIYGPSKLRARNLDSPDIRAGMALVLAALVAEGTSTINRAELIERGYADVVNILKNLGAQIDRAE